MLASDLGERRIIKMFQEAFGKPLEMVVPFGDDVSAVSLDLDRLAVLKADMLVARTDVPPGMSFSDVGWKSMAMSVSDFAAKGIKPQAALITVGIPSYTSRNDIQALSVGLRNAADRYGVRILGGDTNESSDLTVATFLYGVCRKRDIILRNGAKPGDILLVSGNFGLTSSGFRILLENMKAPLRLKKKILQSVYRPQARLSFGLKLKRLGANAAIDSSDGLAWSLSEISKASRVGFIVDEMPIADEARQFAELNNLDPFDLVFYGGEEYEIVASVDPEKYEKTKDTNKKKTLVIGKTVKEKKLLFSKGGLEKKIEAKGWEHFKA